MEQRQILVVDDEFYIRELVGDFLQEHHLSFDSADGFRQAEEKLKSRSFDLILLDWNLESGNSKQLIRIANEQHPDCRIIILTGDHRIRREMINEPSVKEVVYKPFQIQELMNKIQSIWSRDDNQKQ